MVAREVPGASVAYSSGGAPLFVLAERVHHLGGHLRLDTQLLLKASFATSANVRSRPRRPMKPLEELLNPPESQTQPVQSQRGDAQPNTTAESITSATAPETASSGPLPPAVERSPAQRFSQRRFGVVSPQELPSSNSWVGSKNGPDRGNGRNGQGSVNQRESENGGRARTARMEDLREDRDSAAERKRMGFAASTQRRSDPGPSRVSFAQILKSSKAPPQKPTNETPDRAGRPQEKKKEVPIPTEDPEDIMSIPIREAAPRALPSWKVGLANREKRAAKAAVKDGEQRVNEAITAKNVRLVDPEGGSHEVVSIGEALDRARKARLDLVEVNARSDPPVCKLVDYKKFKFEAKKKEKDRKKQELEQRREKIVKEIRLSSRTDYRDMEMKARTAKEHLALGYQVRCFLQFKKGDRRADIGLQLLPEMLKLLESHGNVNKPPREAGGRLEMYLRPLSLAERKKLPEYKKEAGPEPAPEMSKKRKATAVRSEEEGLGSEAGEGEGTEDEWAGEGAEEDGSDLEDEELSEEVEGTDEEEGVTERLVLEEEEESLTEGFDEERGLNEGENAEEAELQEARRATEPKSVLEARDAEAEEEESEGKDEFLAELRNELDELGQMVDFLRADFKKLDAEEKSSPKRKRLADRLRRPLRAKPGRKRRHADSDSDDEDDGRVRRAYDLDTGEFIEEFDESNSDSDGNEKKQRHRQRR